MPRILSLVAGFLLAFAPGLTEAAYQWAAGFPWSWSFTSTGVFLGVGLDSSGNHLAVGFEDRTDFLGVSRDSRVFVFDSAGQLSAGARFGALTAARGSARSVAPDGAGGMVVTGSDDFGYGEAWVLRRLDMSGAVLWTRTFWGWPVYRRGRGCGVAVDAGGDIVVAGTQEGTSPASNWLLVKYDSSGNFLWSRTASAESAAAAVATGPGSNIVFVGYVGRTGVGRGKDWLVMSFNPAGVSLWSRTSDGSAGGDDCAWGVAQDPAGNAYVAGEIGRGDLGEGQDWRIVRYSPAGALAWSRTYGSPAGQDDVAWAAAYSSLDDSVVVGGFEERPDLGEARNWLMKKYTSGGNTVWTVSENDALVDGSEEVRGLAVDGGGAILAGGCSERRDDWLDLGWRRTQAWRLRRYGSGGTLLWAADAPLDRQDTATDIGVDVQNWAWLAGLQERPYRGKDVLVHVYTMTITGQAISASLIDQAKKDETSPRMIVENFNSNTPLPQSRGEAFLAFTSGVTATQMTFVYFNGPGFAKSAVFSAGLDGTSVIRAADVATLPEGEPLGAGTVNAGGVDQFYAVWKGREPSMGSYLFKTTTTATYWSGSSEGIVGRAVARDSMLVGYWAVAEQGGDLLLFRYSATGYTDQNPADFRQEPRPTYPRRLVTPATDQVRAAAEDISGNLWVAGAIDSCGAIWKFTWEGNIAPGFPVTFVYAPSLMLNSLAVDQAGNVLAVGQSGSMGVLVGIGRDGAPLPGLEGPLPVGSPYGDVSLSGVGLEPSGAAWVSGSLAAALSSTLWSGSASLLYRLNYLPPPVAMAPGTARLENPGGAVINLQKGDRLTLLAYPLSGGILRLQVRTMRGGLVWEHELATTGNRVETLVWDGTTSGGAQVASGVYAARLSGAGFDQVIRVVVVRR